MKTEINPAHNYDHTKKKTGYKVWPQTSPSVYRDLGFICGLEVHQQLKTAKKLFCRCPARQYQKHHNYDAEVVRHMRPTLSELGEYDGTALMEFKTKKTILYRLANVTTCTYDVDDTPPFQINQEALKIATEIALLLQTNIVGEMHITRKQYLDGSIPGGFQRTAIIGIDGEIVLSEKKVRIRQLSIEEDSCREVSDIGHLRIYTTDRLGIPLIEAVTYPELLTPDEAAEAAQYIRFLTRSTGKVRTGIGAARQDVNVSIRGGTRVEIKGVAHISHIPEITHNEAFRQKSLLVIKKVLQKRAITKDEWHLKAITPDLDNLAQSVPAIAREQKKGYCIRAVNLPGFAGILSFFTQPGRVFADEISDRLKVIAGIEKPNMIHSEHWDYSTFSHAFQAIVSQLEVKSEDAQIIFWGLSEDISTALETIQERCLWAFDGVPNETRKALTNKTTMFERVLPGPNRMYPDTDSAPISISDDYIKSINNYLPTAIWQRQKQLNQWNIPKDCHQYLLRNHLLPLMEKIINDFDFTPIFVGTALGQRIKGHIRASKKTIILDHERTYALFKFVHEHRLTSDIIKDMLPRFINRQTEDFSHILTQIHYQKYTKQNIINRINMLKKRPTSFSKSKSQVSQWQWVMQQIIPLAKGNIPLAELVVLINQGVHNE